MSMGKEMLGRRHVLPAVVSSLASLQVEATFPSGTFLITVHNPISTDDGDLEKALYGSFLPVPSQDKFPLPDSSVYDAKMQAGAVVAVKNGKITLNEGRKRIQLKVVSKGDRPIQVSIYLRVKKEVDCGLWRNVGWLALPLHRDQSPARVRSRQIPWIPSRYPGRHFHPFRSGRHEDCDACPDWGESDHQGRQRHCQRVYRGLIYCRQDP